MKTEECRIEFYVEFITMGKMKTQFSKFKGLIIYILEKEEKINL